MTTSRTRAPRWWAFPVALCVLVTVGCSTVDGSAAGVGSTVPSPPSTIAGPPDTTDSGPAIDEPSTSPDVSEAPGTEPPADSEVPVTTPDPSSSDLPLPPTTPPLPPTAPSPTASSTSSPAVPGTTQGPRTTPPTSSSKPGPTLRVDRFQSPTRNIGCVIDGGRYVRCDLGRTTIAERHDCQGVGDWGQAISMTAGQKATMICASDTVRDPASPVLPYGSSTRVGSITCTSRTDGMHCYDGRGHGFRLSSASYQVA